MLPTLVYFSHNIYDIFISAHFRFPPSKVKLSKKFEITKLLKLQTKHDVLEGNIKKAALPYKWQDDKKAAFSRDQRAIFFSSICCIKNLT